MKRYIRSSTSNEFQDETKFLHKIQDYLYSNYLKYFPDYHYVTYSPQKWRRGNDVFVDNINYTVNTNTKLYHYYATISLYPDVLKDDCFTFDIRVVDNYIYYYYIGLRSVYVSKGAPWHDNGPVAYSLSDLSVLDIRELKEEAKSTWDLRNKQKSEEYRKYNIDMGDADIPIDNILEGVDKYLRYMSDHYEDDYGSNPKLKLVKLELASGDDQECGFEITFRNNKGKRHKGWIAFINQGNGYCSWDNDVYDRTDDLQEEYRQWIDHIS